MLLTHQKVIVWPGDSCDEEMGKQVSWEQLPSQSLLKLQGCELGLP